MDCISIIRTLTSVNPDLCISVVINKASTLNEARECFARLNGAAQKTGLPELPALGWIADDEAMRQCTRKQETVFDALPTSVSARCITRVAEHLANQLAPVERRGSGMSGLLQAVTHAMGRTTAPPDL